MGQIIGSAAKPKRCNLQSLSSFGTPAAGEYILVSSDNSMNAAGQGNFDSYIVGDGATAATALELLSIKGNTSVEGVFVGDTSMAKFFTAEEIYSTDIFTSAGAYVSGNVGSIITTTEYASLQWGRVPIAYKDVFTLKTSGFGNGRGYFITDSELRILERSAKDVNITDYEVTYSNAAYLYINCLTNYLSKFNFSKKILSSELDNEYAGGVDRIPSAESVKKLHTSIGQNKIEMTIHVEPTEKKGSIYTAYYILPYYADGTSVVTINNVILTSTGGGCQLEFNNGDRLKSVAVQQLQTGNTYDVKLTGKCSVISTYSYVAFSCDVTIEININDWDNTFPCYGLKVATLGDSITSISHCNIGQLMPAYLHAGLINNFALAQAYAADWSTTEPYFDSQQGSATADNVLSNQVRRLLRWTTEEGAQITWTHPIAGTFSIDTSVGVGLGHTDDIPDIIYIAIGTNDSADKNDNDLDVLVSTSYANLTRLTIGSAYRWAIETLQSAYPNAMIFLASPLSTGTKALYKIEKGEILKYVCEITGAYYIPSREESGYTDLIATNNGGLHPNTVWSNKIAQFVAKKIEEAFVKTWRDNS